MLICRHVNCATRFRSCEKGRGVMGVLGLFDDVTELQILAVASTGGGKDSDNVTTQSLGPVSLTPECISICRRCCNERTE
jgi:hypothetical protein